MQYVFVECGFWAVKQSIERRDENWSLNRIIFTKKLLCPYDNVIAVFVVYIREK